MQQKLAGLVERLKTAFGDQLVSAILYGSAAAGDYHEHASDLNVLCVLSQITPHELVQSEPVFRWWRQDGNPSPLLLTEEEVDSSSDSFPDGVSRYAGAPASTLRQGCDRGVSD